MKTVLLAGGLGTRLAEESESKPKPMVEVGGRPILWHIMRSYAARGFKEFVVALGYRNEFDMGHEPSGEMAMDPYPLGAASLSVTKKGVLVVEDLTGGTSAISSLYRFRYDKAAHRMRLIGDDVTYYSRTNSHDQLNISTNRLTGLRLRQVGVLNEGDGDEAYHMQPETRETVPTTPVWMEDAPPPDVTLGLGLE